MRWIFRGLVALVVLAAVLALSLLVIPTERIADLAASQFSQATGRQLTIDGDVRPSIYPMLGVRAEAVEVGNPDWVSEGPMLRASSMHVGVDLAALLSGSIRVSRFELVSPEIVLVRRADGTASWDFGEAQAAPAETDTGASAIPAFNLDLAEIRNGALLFLDRVGGVEFAIRDLDAEVRLPSSDGEAHVTLAGTVNGSRISADTTIDGLAQLLAGDLRPVEMSLEWTGGEAGFSGRAGMDPMGAEGTVTLDASDLGPVMALAGQDAPALPEGLGHDRIAVSGMFTLATEGSMHLRDATINLDDTRLSGDVDVTQGADRPFVRARLTGEAVDLSAMAGGGSGGEAAGGWSRDRIDVSSLFSADAEVALALSSMDLGLAEVGPVDLRTTLSAGRMVFDLRQIGLYGGEMTGEFVVNGRGGLSVGGNLAFEGVQLSPLLTAMADMERLEGTGSGQLRFLGVGNDLDTIMRSLDGEGNLEFGSGAILGLDLAGMLRNLDASYRGEGARTVYDSIAASFTMENGELRNDDLEMLAPLGQVTGEGSVDLGAQTLEYRLIPEVLRNGAENGIRVPVRIHGPWASPRFAPDLEYLAQERLDEEREQLEQQAREELERRAEEVLGVEIQEGDTPQDVLENALRQEADNQMRRLLGLPEPEPEPVDPNAAPVTGQ